MVKKQKVKLGFQTGLQILHEVQAALCKVTRLFFGITRKKKKPKTIQPGMVYFDEFV